MKKGLMLFFLLVIFFITKVDAGAIAISPATYKDFFTPNFHKVYEFYASTSDPNGNISIYVNSDLQPYVTLSKKYITGGGYFEVKVNLPKNISIPGNHPIFVGALDLRENGGNNVEGRAAVEARIDIFVPYPGVYLESSFDIGNVNQNENASYELVLKNLGTKNIVVKPTINLFEKNESIKVFSEILEEVPMESKESVTIKNNLKTSNFKAGNYLATLTLEYNGKTDKLEKNFRIGEFVVDVVDYSYLFQKGKINLFFIEIESKWNTPIETVYADVMITDGGKTIEEFRTSFTNLKAWERKNLTGYLDTSKLETKRYIASINLFYGDKAKNKLVAVYIQNPPKKEILIYVIAGTVLLIALIAIIFLIIKIKKLKLQR